MNNSKNKISFDRVYPNSIRSLAIGSVDISREKKLDKILGHTILGLTGAYWGLAWNIKNPDLLTPVFYPFLQALVTVSLVLVLVVMIFTVRRRKSRISKIISSSAILPNYLKVQYDMLIQAWNSRPHGQIKFFSKAYRLFGSIPLLKDELDSDLRTKALGLLVDQKSNQQKDLVTQELLELTENLPTEVIKDLKGQFAMKEINQNVSQIGLAYIYEAILFHNEQDNFLTSQQVQLVACKSESVCPLIASLPWKERGEAINKRVARKYGRCTVSAQQIEEHLLKNTHRSLDIILCKEWTKSPQTL